MSQWGFRRSEDIVWVHQSNSLVPLSDENSSTKTSSQMKNGLFVQSKEHWLLGIKGTIRRSLDSHLIHTNIDTDVIVTSDEDLGLSKIGKNHTVVPGELFKIMERLCLGRRRLYF